MHAEDLKFWHWMLAGLLVGLIFSGVKLWQGPWFDTQDLDTIDQGRLERGLVGQAGTSSSERLIPQYVRDQTTVKDVVVHPPLPGESKGVYWVTGKECLVQQQFKDEGGTSHRIVTEKWQPFKCPAPAPFQGHLGAPGKYQNVLQYLQAMDKKFGKKFSYKYAWWEMPAPTLAMCPLAGLLIIGIAWPMALGLLQQGGLARPPKVKVKLPKSRPAQPAAAKVAGMGSVEDYNEDLEASLGATTGTAVAAANTSESTVKPLTAVAEPVSAAANTVPEDVEYGGEFYPVVRPVHHEPPDPKKK